MLPPFFPDPTFGLTFLAVLAAFLAVASYLDLRFTVIPKGLTLAALATGVVLNVARGAWLASRGLDTWTRSQPGPMWVLGVCGGGDVKFFAALGAWVGPKYALYVLAATVAILAALILATAFVAFLRGDLVRLRGRRAKAPGRPGKRLVTFALPLSLATAFVLAWSLRYELNLVPAAPALAQQHGGNNAR